MLLLSLLSTWPIQEVSFAIEGDDASASRNKVH